MNREDFAISFEKGCLRSKRLLLKKENEYAMIDTDRLCQFKKVGAITNESPEEVCIGFMSKHFSSICDMSFEPDHFTLKQWREKITDLRNYTHLLDAIVEERLEK